MLYASQITKEFKALDYRGVRWEAIHSFYCLMGGFRVSQPDSGEGFIPYDTMFKLLKRGHVKPEGIPSSSKIKSKSKQDGLIKILTLLQAGSFVIRIVARAVERLPITTLEFSALAFLPGTICMIIFWWNKPYDITDPTTIVIHHRVIEPGPNHSILCSDFAQIRISVVDLKYSSTSKEIMRIIRKESMIILHSFSLITAVFFIVYGGIHLAAWNFSFATSIEQTLWRVSSIIMTGVLPLSWGITSFAHKAWTQMTDANWDERGNPIIQLSFRGWRLKANDTAPKKNITIPMVQIVHGTAVLFYAAARIYVLLEALLALRSLPSQCYDTVSWPAYLPFFS